MPLMPDYIARVGLSDVTHIIHGAELSLRTATDIASRINTLNPDINLHNEINTLLEIETQLYNIYKTINRTIEEQS
jgi:gp40